MVDFLSVQTDLHNADVHQKYRNAHNPMKWQLEALESDYASGENDNYATSRHLPSDQDSGAGYKRRRWNALRPTMGTTFVHVSFPSSSVAIAESRESTGIARTHPS